MADFTDIKDVLAKGETLTVEFKSDRKCLSGKALITAVVALANTEGGGLFLGVEDNREITGLHSNHRDLNGLAALIPNRKKGTVLFSITK